jgi:hypothetical protein
MRPGAHSKLKTKMRLVILFESRFVPLYASCRDRTGSGLFR